MPILVLFFLPRLSADHPVGAVGYTPMQRASSDLTQLLFPALPVQNEIAGQAPGGRAGRRGCICATSAAEAAHSPLLPSWTDSCSLVVLEDAAPLKRVHLFQDIMK